MATSVRGIHHVTALSGDPQENLDFYVGLLGLRLVKRSVNQDSPGIYHLFYADGVGTPGTDLTFFPYPGLPDARPGAGMAVEVAFGIRPDSLAYWRDRLAERGVEVDEEVERFGERVLPFRDPHGLPLALVATDDERPWVPWEGSPVPEPHQLRGMHSVRTRQRRLEPTRAVLEEALGFQLLDREDGWARFGVEGGGSGRLLDVRADPDHPAGRQGAGGIHHVAWRVSDDDEERSVRAAVLEAGLRPTEQIDRFWFRSVYFNEPGGVLFELATDGPGFDRDEEPDRLGRELILPPWLEDRRDEIEAELPALTVPAGAEAT